jgi:hypothetical protein
VFLTDALDRVKDAQPDTRRGKCEKAGLGGLEVVEHVVADDSRHNDGDDRREDNEFPRFFPERDAGDLLEINGSLFSEAYIIDRNRRLSASGIY